MKVNLYTQAVLSVIAAALLYICVQNTIYTRVVSAQSQTQTQPSPQKVILVKDDGTPLSVYSGPHPGDERLAVSLIGAAP
jgi:hypothetical protein